MCQVNSAHIKRIAIYLLLIFPFFVSAQKTKSQLEEEKRDNLKQIAQTEKILSETKSEKKATLGQLSAINQQIKVRESLMLAITQEISLLNSEISDLTIIVLSLETDLINLKREYANMIYHSYKANHGYSLLTFLFSAKTFNQLYMRLKYLQQYAEARTLQASQIEAVAAELNQQKSDVEFKKEEQNHLLDQQKKENKKLVELKNEKSNLLANLGKKETQLRTEMANRKKSIERLDKLIADFIRKELEKNKTMSTVALGDEVAISERFEQNKLKLPWPVTTGFISSKFGRQPHPLWKNVIVENTGVDIQTKGNEEVMSVFEGEVKTKAFVPGMNNVVIVKHGNYYTVYSKLKEVKVSAGQQLKRSDIIGTVHTNTEGISEIHFEVWKNTQKLDPEKWLIN